MKKRPFELQKYFLDFVRYKNLNQRMFWFQKFKRFDWLYGQNFGDYLSFIIVGEVLRQKNLLPLPSRQKGDNKLLAIGSIIHFAKENDIIWGSGVNGKMHLNRYTFKKLDVRMVRGPLTKAFLEERNINVMSSVYGDPALLLPILFPNLKARPIKGKKLILPNFNELDMVKPLVPQGFSLLSPIGYWKNIVSEILTSEQVFTSSLHGLIVAEVFGVPVRFVAPSGGETLFKYEDYLLGTGRSLVEKPTGFLEGINIDMGVTFSRPIINTAQMLELFPFDFFKTPN